MGAQTGPSTPEFGGDLARAYFYVLAPLGTDPIVQQLSPRAVGRAPW